MSFNRNTGRRKRQFGESYSVIPRGSQADIERHDNEVLSKEETKLTLENKIASNEEQMTRLEDAPDYGSAVSHSREVHDALKEENEALRSKLHDVEERDTT